MPCCSCRLLQRGNHIAATISNLRSFPVSWQAIEAWSDQRQQPEHGSCAACSAHCPCLSLQIAQPVHHQLGKRIEKKPERLSEHNKQDSILSVRLGIRELFLQCKLPDTICSSFERRILLDQSLNLPVHIHNHECSVPIYISLFSNHLLADRQWSDQVLQHAHHRQYRQLAEPKCCSVISSVQLILLRLINATITASPAI